MIQSANKYSIATLFEPESKVRYRVPRYQRAYSWTTGQWNDLFDDITDSMATNGGGHFLGSIICINRSTDALGQIDLEVVDGQQRLATLSLLYAAIHRRMLDIPPAEAPEELMVDRMNTRNRLCLKKDGVLRLGLSHQSSNDADYQAVLCAAGVLKDTGPVMSPDMKGRSIYRAYHHFVKRISAMTLADVEDLLDRTNRAEVVKIEVDSSSDAFLLFESLNDRGLALTAMDLIKNKALARIESLQPETVDAQADRWAAMASRIPEAEKYQERFLRQAYNSRTNAPLTKNDNVLVATRSNLIHLYETSIDGDVFSVVDDLDVKSIMNDAFLHPESARGDLALFRDGLSDLLHVQAAPAYTVVFYLLMEHRSDPELIQETIAILVKYFLRRNVTDFPQTRKLDAMLMDLITHCRQVDHLDAAGIREFLTQETRYSSDERFRENLLNDIYEHNVDAARFILCSLEKAHETKETEHDLWRRDSMSSYIWTIEHILPEGGNLPHSWVNAIGGGSLDEARRIQSQWTHKLGNLTLTGYNATLSNDSFVDKRDRKDGTGNWVGYRNGIYLNAGIPAKEAWTVRDIEERTQRLVDETMEMFKL